MASNKLNFKDSKINKSIRNILLTIPSFQDKGGVVSLFDAVLPHITDNIIPLEIGGTKGINNFFHPMTDQLYFHKTLIKSQHFLVHINPSLNLKSFLRDGAFAWQAKKRNIPLLVFWHGWDKPFSQVVEKHLLWFFRQTFGRADCFIVLASEFKHKLRAWGVTAPVHLGTTAVEEQLIQGFNLEKKIEAIRTCNTLKILFLARLERAKGVFETVQAVRLLLDKNFPVSLTIAGDGHIRQELEQYCQSLDLTEQQVCFIGDVRGEEKISTFAEHHIYCLPSYGEGLPNSVLEAMAFAMPVTTRPVGGLADMFEDGVMGGLAQGKTSEEIASVLERLITDREKLVAIARYNAAYAKEYFMASVVAAELQRIYGTILPDDAGTVE